MARTTQRRTPWAWLAAIGASSLLAGFAIQPATATTTTPPVRDTVVTQDALTEYDQRFLELYEDIHNPDNGYFSPQGIPYHAVETLMVEAPDYGHETTSEAYSFWIWLEAVYGRVTGDWEPLNHAWETMETYMIPQSEDQPTNSFYNPNSPATYAAEYNHPSQYPSELNSGVSSGRDPIGAELRQTYGTSDIYGMHWLADVDNIYGYGAAPGPGCTLGPDYEGVSYINTFQRGPQESVWETIPQPSCEEFEFGGPNGYLDLFTKDSNYAKQWKYTNAPDADARAIDGIYWAKKWAEEQGKGNEIAATVDKASKMGDYLRYAMFDKYFKEVGCNSPSCTAAQNRESAHYLLSWYYAWGGATDSNAGWAWRIGSSHAHFGYQNPMAAWVLSTDADLIPQSPTAQDDWAKSMDRQLEFYQWLQSADGGIAGGATNSWDGAYAAKPAGTPTFYGMGYTEAPVYHDPPSNEWFGMQVWSLERVAQLLHETDDPRAKKILDKWVPWALENTNFTDDENWSIPSNLAWSGKPDTWNPSNPGNNAGLTVTVSGHGQDVGVAAAYARTLMYYAAATGDDAAQEGARKLLDYMWEYHRDDIGVSTTEKRGDYKRFDDVYTAGGDGTYVPPGWSGTMPNGDVIEPGVSFLDIRSFYLDDPDWPKVQAYLDGGEEPEFNYHRFWAQTAIATALADYEHLFNDADPDPEPTDPDPEPTDPTDPDPDPTDPDPEPTDPTDPDPEPTDPTDPGEGGTCDVTYTTNDWNSGFTATVKITNTSTQPINGWSLAFTFPAGQQITNLWSATNTSTGSTATITNAAWNPTINAGQTVEFGFNGTHNGNNPAPTSFTLNGATCS